MDIHVVSIDKRGRITIPAAIRRHLGLQPGDKVVFEVHPGPRIVISKADVQHQPESSEGPTLPTN
ncbi:MAG: type II toxin-antitoxin system PrlF family antitoxin [Thermomicrobiales bacterium]|nr:type II toxin-antitoxin system PrlF family antitoxin [Thermomicrobiales bacterium]